MKTHASPSEPRLWTLPFTVLISSLSLQVIANFILVVSLPLYLNAQGLSSSAIGAMASALTIATVVARPFAGKLVDLHGRKLVLLIAMMMSFAVSVLYYFLADHLAALFVLRIIQGVANGMSTAASGTLMADIVHKKRLDQALALNNVAVQLGIGLGSVVSFTLAEKLGFHSNFILVSLMTGTAALLAMKLPIDDRKLVAAAKTSSGSRPSSARGFIHEILNLFEWSTLIPASVMFPAYFAFCTVSNYLALYAAGIGGIDASGYFALSSVVTIAFGMNVHRVRQWLTFKVMVPASLSCIVAGFLCLALLEQAPFLLLVAAVLISMGMGLLTPTMNAQIFRYAPAHRKGAANATYHSTLDLSQAIGAALWGVFASIFGYQAMFAWCALFPAFGIICFACVFYPRYRQLPD